MSFGERLRDGTWIFESQAHYTPSAAALHTAISGALDGEELPVLHSLTTNTAMSGGGERDQFEEGVREELSMRFGDSFAKADDDPRGVFAFPATAPVRGETHEETAGPLILR